MHVCYSPALRQLFFILAQDLSYYLKTNHQIIPNYYSYDVLLFIACLGVLFNSAALHETVCVTYCPGIVLLFVNPPEDICQD